MFLSNWAMAQASAEVRAISAAMATAVAELGHPASWTGADAERFEREWTDLVTNRLLTAANKLDGVTFTELIGGFDGD